MERRVLIFTNHYTPEGSFKIGDIAECLAEQNFKVKVVTCVPNYPSGVFLKGFGVFKNNTEKRKNLFIRRLPLIPRGSGGVFRLILNYLSYFLTTITYTLFGLIFMKKNQLVFVHHTSPFLICISALLYKKIRKSKLVIWDLDIWPETLEAVGVITNKKILKAIEKVVKYVYDNCDKILVGSNSFLQIVEKRVKKETPVIYFPNWAEKCFEENIIIRPSVSLMFPKELKIMFAGNIGEAQDFENVLKVIALVKDLEVSWLFVGDGRVKSWLQHEIERQGLQNKVHFYGAFPLENMPYFFQKADVLFVSLKDKKIFGQTVPARVQAYLGAAKPILAMLNGEGAEIIKLSKSGYVANAGDYSSMAEQIRDVVKNPSKLNNCGLNGRRFYEANFSKTARMEQILKIAWEFTT